MSASLLVPEQTDNPSDTGDTGDTSDTAQANDELRPDREVHIAGIVVHVRPGDVAAIRKQIPLIPSAEIHAASEDGRLIVTLEADSARRTVDYMDAIRALPGVLNVVLVYQHAEPASALDEEIES